MDEAPLPADGPDSNHSSDESRSGSLNSSDPELFAELNWAATNFGMIGR